MYINLIPKPINRKFLLKSYIYAINLGLESCIYTLYVILVSDI